MTQEKNVYRIFLSNQMEMETCAMVSEVVMKNHDKAVLLRNVSISMKEVVPMSWHIQKYFKI